MDLTDNEFSDEADDHLPSAIEAAHVLTHLSTATATSGSDEDDDETVDTVAQSLSDQDAGTMEQMVVGSPAVPHFDFSALVTCSYPPSLFGMSVTAPPSFAAIIHESDPVQAWQQHRPRLSPLHLPELLYLVFFHCSLSPTTLASASRVCRAWHAIASPMLTDRLVFLTTGSAAAAPERCFGWQQTTSDAQAVQQRWPPRALTYHRCEGLRASHVLDLYRDPDADPRRHLRVLDLYVCSDLDVQGVLAAALSWRIPSQVPPQDEIRSMLTTLKLAGCPAVDDAAVSLVAAHCPYLRVLDLRACYLVSDASLVPLARSCRALVHFNVGRVTLTWVTRVHFGAAATAMAAAGGGSTFEDDGARVTDVTALAIATYCPIITTVGLAGTHVTDRGAKALLTRAVELRRLSLNGCPMIGPGTLMAAGQRAWRHRTSSNGSIVASLRPLVSLEVRDTPRVAACSRQVDAAAAELLNKAATAAANSVSLAHTNIGPSSWSVPYGTSEADAQEILAAHVESAKHGRSIWRAVARLRATGCVVGLPIGLLAAVRWATLQICELDLPSAAARSASLLTSTTTLPDPTTRQGLLWAAAMRWPGSTRYAARGPAVPLVLVQGEVREEHLMSSIQSSQAPSAAW
ncbi:hypothetical protein BC828DRAFT_393508 [Blastocladiella britannica]|nr:hypothetical protein BC828DRAFT_393508 [Blastocladiella britannica]